MEEIWKPIPSAQGYEVSNLGNVRTNKPRNKKSKGGGYRPVKTCNHRKKNPYKVFIASFGENRKTILVHRAMLEAFVSPCPEGMESCHNDGDSLNNVLSNLRWDTKRENILDQVRHGTHNAIHRRGKKWKKLLLNS